MLRPIAAAKKKMTALMPAKFATACANILSLSLRASHEDRELCAQAKRAFAGQQWNYTQNYADANSAVVQDIMFRA
jgi:GrpB-like predicted nucleotidyltransferase (UPF0157 family)